MGGKVSLAELGIDRGILKKKLKVEGVGVPKWRNAITVLLDQEEDNYTVEEAGIILSAVCSPADRAVLADPDDFNHRQVRVAKVNKELQEKAYELLGSRPTATPAEPRPAEDGEIELIQHRSRRYEVKVDGLSVGQIWRTRIRLDGDDDYTAGWTHSRTEKLFTGKGSKDTAVEHLVAMAARGEDFRETEPAWMVRERG